MPSLHGGNTDIIKLKLESIYSKLQNRWENFLGLHLGFEIKLINTTSTYCCLFCYLILSGVFKIRSFGD